MAMFFRQFWKFFFTFFLITSIAALYTIYATPIYESNGSILIKFGSDARPDVSKPDQVQPEMTPNERRELIESYTKILQSHDLLIALIKEFGAENVYPKLAKVQDKETAPEMAYEKLAKGDMAVKTGMQSNIIEIRILNSNPRLASQFLRRLLEQFIIRQSDVFNKPQVEFIAEQVKHSSEVLEKAQKALQDFKESNGLSSVEEEMNRLLQEKSDAKSVALKSIDDAQKKVDELKARETQLLMTYQADSPAVLKLRESLYSAQAQLRAKQVDLKAGTIGGEEYKATTLSPHIKDIGVRMKLLETQRSQYNDLARQVLISEENYKHYVSKLEEARVKETLNQQNITRISVLDEPTLPLTPIKPNKLFILVISIIGGFIMALGVMIAFESLDERFSKPEQISALLKAPVMVSFGRMKKMKKR